MLVTVLMQSVGHVLIHQGVNNVFKYKYMYKWEYFFQRLGSMYLYVNVAGHDGENAKLIILDPKYICTTNLTYVKKLVKNLTLDLGLVTFL